MQANYSESTPLPDNPSKILNLISFLCPPLGLVIYLVLVGKMPRQALSAGLWGARGIAGYFSLAVLMGIIAVGMTLWDNAHPYQEPVTAMTTPPMAVSPPKPGMAKLPGGQSTDILR